MTGRKRLILQTVLTGLPAVLFVLWVASGREVLTKPARSVEVEVVDEVFGDTLVETRFERGPILGYYVGIDLVVVSLVLSAVAAGLWWWWERRQRPQPANEGKTYDVHA